MKKKTINIILGSLLTGSMVAGVVDAIAETKTDPEPQKEQDQQKRLSMILSKIRESVLGVVGRSIVDNEYNKPTTSETTQTEERSNDDRTLFEKIAQKNQQIDALGIGSLSVKFKHDDMHNLDNVGKQLAPKLIDIIEPSELDTPVASGEGAVRSAEPADKTPDTIENVPDEPTDLDPIVRSGDLPVDLPSDVPTELPSEVPGDVPHELPSELPGDLPHELPSELPGDAPHELPSELPSELPGDAPHELPSELPGDLPHELPSELPGDLPSELPQDVPGDTPHELPGELPGDLPSELPGDVPHELPSELPSDVPGDTPGDVPGDVSDGIGHDDELDSRVNSNPGNFGSNATNNPTVEDKTPPSAPTNPFNQSDLPIVDMKVGDVLFGKEVKHVPSNKLSYRQILSLSEDDRYKKSLEDIDESYVAGNSQMWLGAGDSVVKSFNNNEFLDRHLLNRYFVNYVNAERKLHGIGPLEYEPGFQKQADIRALEMAEYGHIRYNGHAHTRPNGDKWITVMDGVVPHYPYGLGENILAYSVLSNPYQLTSEQFVAKTLFERWKNSKSHYENMMDSRLTRTAVSVKLTTRAGAKSENETNWIIGEQILADGKVGDIL